MCVGILRNSEAEKLSVELVERPTAINSRSQGAANQQEEAGVAQTNEPLERVSSPIGFLASPGNGTEEAILTWSVRRVGLRARLVY